MFVAGVLILHLFVLANGRELPPLELAAGAPKVLYELLGTSIHSDGDIHLSFSPPLKAMAGLVKKMQVKISKAYEIPPDPVKNPRLFGFRARADRAFKHINFMLRNFGMDLNFKAPNSSSISVSEHWFAPPPTTYPPFKSREISHLAYNGGHHVAKCKSGWEDIMNSTRGLLVNDLYHTWPNGSTFYKAKDVSELAALTEILEDIESAIFDLSLNTITSSIVDQYHLEKCYNQLKNNVLKKHAHAEVVPQSSSIFGRRFSRVIKRAGEVVILVHLSYIERINKFNVFKVHASQVITKSGPFGLVLPKKQLLAISKANDKTFFIMDEDSYGNHCDHLYGSRVCAGRSIIYVQHYEGTIPSGVRCAYSIYEEHEEDAVASCEIEAKRETEIVTIVNSDNIITSSHSGLKTDCGSGRLVKTGQTHVHSLKPGCIIKSNGLLVHGKNNAPRSKIVARDYPKKIVEFLMSGERAVKSVARRNPHSTIGDLQGDSPNDSVLIHDALVIFFAIVLFTCAALSIGVIIFGTAFALKYFFKSPRQVAVHENNFAMDHM